MMDDAPTDFAHGTDALANGDAAPAALRRSLIESLYTEAMLLADEARGYFESAGQEQRHQLDPLSRIGYSCESLKTTTRLMHVIAWLLTQRAISAGEISQQEAGSHDRLLGDAVPSDAAVCAKLPDQARLLIASSEQLYKRTLRLQEQFLGGRPPVDSPVHHMLAQLQSRY